MRLFILRKLLRAVFVTGNQTGMQDFFNEVYDAAHAEFTEDNRASLDSFLNERLRRASDRNWNKAFIEHDRLMRLHNR